MLVAGGFYDCILVMLQRHKMIAALVCAFYMYFTKKRFFSLLFPENREISA
jgi:hypothetical protein